MRCIKHLIETSQNGCRGVEFIVKLHVFFVDEHTTWYNKYERNLFPI